MNNLCRFSAIPAEMGREGEGEETLKLARAVQCSMVTGTVNKTDLT